MPHVFFFQAEDGIRDLIVTGVQTCALPISRRSSRHRANWPRHWRQSHGSGGWAPPPPRRYRRCRRRLNRSSAFLRYRFASRLTMLAAISAGERLTTPSMAQTLVPHLVNDQGVDRIAIGVKEFQCMGASPPHDHPHVYLDMGHEAQIVCPYCSTLFVHDGALKATESEPPACIYVATSPPGAPAA